MVDRPPIGEDRHPAYSPIIRASARARRRSLKLSRLISHLLRLALVLADERTQPSIDASIMNSAILLLYLEPPSPLQIPAAKPRFDRDPRARK